MMRLPSGRSLRSPLVRLFAVTLVVVALGTSAWSIEADAGSYHSPGDACASSPTGHRGIQWARRTGVHPRCGQQAVGGSTLPSPTYNGSPPLTNHGGAVVGGASPGTLTITPVYWVPAGGAYSIPSSYETLINRFISDAAAASGKTTDVFAALTQYTNFLRDTPEVPLARGDTDHRQRPLSRQWLHARFGGHLGLIRPGTASASPTPSC